MVDYNFTSILEKNFENSLLLTPKQVEEQQEFIEWCIVALQEFVTNENHDTIIAYDKELTDIIKYFYRVYVDATIDFDIVEKIYFPVESLTQLVFDYYLYRQFFLNMQNQ